MSDSHFVSDYKKHVRDIQDGEVPEVSAAKAIGSIGLEEFRRQGDQQAFIMMEAGLENGFSLYDFACGSGRTASALHRAGWSGDYLGVDVVDQLLEAFGQICPASFQTKIHTGLSIAAGGDSLDMVCGWSIFTHLYAVESYIYLEDIHRALKPGGTLVMSFLEFQQYTHWDVFNQNIERRKSDAQAPLDAFISRDDLKSWCEHIGLEVERFIDGMDEQATPFGPIGQSVAIITKPFDLL